MCHIPIKILKQYAIPNSSLQSLKIIHQEGAEKLDSQKGIVCM